MTSDSQSHGSSETDHETPVNGGGGREGTARGGASGAPPLPYSKAVKLMCKASEANKWFLDSYWPENEPRTRLMVEMVRDRFPISRDVTVLDVGCGLGYMTYLFHLLGYRAVGADGLRYPERDALFASAGIDYAEVNLNAPDGLSWVSSGSAHVVLLGEVIEHILNHPTGLLAELYRILRPGGLLLLTTPNPSTLMNAWRVLRDNYLLWGTPEFLDMPKVNAETGALTTYAGLHYREYPAWVMRDTLVKLGFTCEDTRYCAAGATRVQPLWKQVAKKLVPQSSRLLAPGYVIAARK